jgi:cell wall-associated NlpC family hydrolase
MNLLEVAIEVIYDELCLMSLIKLTLRRNKLPIIFSLGILSLAVTLISAISNDRLIQVIESTNNQLIKDSLAAFGQGEIEKPVDVMYSIDTLVQYANSFLGTPHKMGGTDKKGIDCSGFVRVVHNKFGIELPHNSHALAHYGKIIANQDSLQKGDLVFFYNSYRCANFFTHSGIYLEDGNFIHASASKGVIISKLTEGYWGERYVFGTRLMP